MSPAIEYSARSSSSASSSKALVFPFRATLVTALMVVIGGCAQDKPAAGPPAYVGSAQCSGCHSSESEAWRSSHHAHSMEPATDQTMPAGSAEATVSSASGPVKLLRKADGTYSATMSGSDGKSTEFPISYTFGVYPLQEYLVTVPGGRLQVLSVARDTRPPEQGGQRWFSLYPDQHFPVGDPLHWMGRDQNWNFMCADCHSTDLRRGYDSATDTYATTFSEVNVACEACHGPGSQHVALMRAGGSRGNGTAHELGLSVELHAARTVQWGLWSAEQRIASPRGDLQAAAAQSAVCFPCHARRQTLTQSAAPGEALLDNYLPQVIEPGVYHSDGQVDAEDFEFGSFVQSKMYAKGVTCTNCHEAHSLKLRAGGNALCTQCHRADIYDQSTHHHHAETSTGGQCVNCHMPEKTYMIVHSRRDHSFRVPRPDLTVAIGTPNTCNQCHRDKQATWSVAAIESWTKRSPAPVPARHYASAIQDSWDGADATSALLVHLSDTPPLSGFVRASLLGQLGMQAQQPQPLAQSASRALEVAATDPDPMVRVGVAHSLPALPAEDAVTSGATLLKDRTRAVRVEAARALVGATEEQLGTVTAEQLRVAVDELIAAERATAERPESHVNVAQIFVRMDRDGDAENELNAALRLDKGFVPAMVDLADLNRSRGHEDEAERWLRQAMAAAPRAAAPVHALGLLQVRRGEREGALASLAKAVELDPANARYTYVYVTALAEFGQTRQATKALNVARERLPKDASLAELQQQLTAPDSAGASAANGTDPVTHR